MTAHIGELAALGTAVSWTVAALIMENAVKRVGVMAVNTLKVTFGSVYLAALAFILLGSPVPHGLSPSAWGFLGASGLVGFVIGDYFLLHAYDWIGSRLSMLLMALSVPFTALGAYAVFGRLLGPGRLPAWPSASEVSFLPCSRETFKPRRFGQGKRAVLEGHRLRDTFGNRHGGRDPPD